jgi:hypothetical protein
VGGAARAETIIDQIGTTGDYDLIDDSSHAGATCRYAFEGDLLRIRVRARLQLRMPATPVLASTTNGWVGGFTSTSCRQME